MDVAQEAIGAPHGEAKAGCFFGPLANRSFASRDVEKVVQSIQVPPSGFALPAEVYGEFGHNSRGVIGPDSDSAFAIVAHSEVDGDKRQIRSDVYRCFLSLIFLAHRTAFPSALLLNYPALQHETVFAVPGDL